MKNKLKIIINIGTLILDAYGDSTKFSFFFNCLFGLKFNTLESTFILFAILISKKVLCFLIKNKMDKQKNSLLIKKIQLLKLINEPYELLERCNTIINLITMITRLNIPAWPFQIIIFARFLYDKLINGFLNGKYQNITSTNKIK